MRKEVLVDVCLSGMIQDYRMHLQHFPFLSFSWQMEAESWTNKLAKRTKIATVITMPQKCPLKENVEKSKEA